MDGCGTGLFTAGCLAAAMVVFLFAGVAALIVTLIVTQGRKRTETLQSAASTFGGAVSSSFWSGDRVDLVVDGVPAEVTFHSGGKHSSPWTRLHFRWTPPGLLRLVPEDLFTSLQKVFGTQDLQVGDPDFDRRFLVRGSPEAWVREVLDAGTRRHLIGIAELGGSGRRGGLEAGPSGVVLFRHKNLCMDRILLEAFIQKSIEVFRRLRAPAPAEIKILSTEELIARGECPVCGHPLDATARRCKSCATAHHAECWDYFGGCSTCGGARQGGKPEA